MIGQISSVSNIDQYLLPTPCAGSIALTLSSVENVSSGWVLELRDAAGTILSSGVCDYSSCQNGITVPVGVSGAGIYTAVVRSKSPNYAPRGLYPLTATYEN